MISCLYAIISQEEELIADILALIRPRLIFIKLIREHASQKIETNRH
jgi:hypothetical protein